MPDEKKITDEQRIALERLQYAIEQEDAVRDKLNATVRRATMLQNMSVDRLKTLTEIQRRIQQNVGSDFYTGPMLQEILRAAHVPKLRKRKQLPEGVTPLRITKEKESDKQ